MGNTTPQSVKDELMKVLIEKSSRRRRIMISCKIGFWQATVFVSYLIKRCFDAIASAILFVLFTPLYLFTALCIYIESPGPVIYKQVRVGLNGRHFYFYKFRSMVMNADKMKDQLINENESGDGVIFKMKDDPRITRTGKIIRKLSIDELPQLYNVLIGDMSLVGPRPPLPREVAEYTMEERKRLHATPGITCIWQVSGRSDIPFNEQVQLDKEYIKSKSIIKDIWILVMTIPAVITGKGAY